MFAQNMTFQLLDVIADPGPFNDGSDTAEKLLFILLPLVLISAAVLFVVLKKKEAKKKQESRTFNVSDEAPAKAPGADGGQNGNA